METRWYDFYFIKIQKKYALKLCSYRGTEKWLGSGYLYLYVCCFWKKSLTKYANVYSRFSFVSIVKSVISMEWLNREQSNCRFFCDNFPLFPQSKGWVIRDPPDCAYTVTFRLKIYIIMEGIFRIGPILDGQ